MQLNISANEFSTSCLPKPRSALSISDLNSFCGALEKRLPARFLSFGLQVPANRRNCLLIPLYPIVKSTVQMFQPLHLTSVAKKGGDIRKCSAKSCPLCPLSGGVICALTDCVCMLWMSEPTQEAVYTQVCVHNPSALMLPSRFGSAYLPPSFYAIRGP